MREEGNEVEREEWEITPEAEEGDVWRRQRRR